MIHNSDEARRQAANKIIAMYIIAVGETGASNSAVWLMVDPQMQDLDVHLMTVGLLKKIGVVEEKNYFLTLTEKGQETHRKLVEVFMPTEKN